MHSYYSNKSQSIDNAGYTIMVAEVASTVNEIILAENALFRTDIYSSPKYT